MILPLADRVKVLDDWEAGETQTCLWDCTHLNPCSLNVRLLMLSGCRCMCESQDMLPTKACLAQWVLIRPFMARARLVLNWAGDSCGCLRVLSIQPKILNWRLSSVLTLEFDGLQTADLDRRMAQATGSNLESRAGRGGDCRKI